jgi:hypothetical protein
MPISVKRPGFSHLSKETSLAVPAGIVFEDSAGNSWYCWVDTNGSMRIAPASDVETGSPSWNLGAGKGGVQYTETLITAAMVTATGAGNLGHASGVPLIAAPPTGYVLEFISAFFIYDYATAGYSAGGNLTVNLAGGAALTGVLSAANSFGATADKVYQFVPLSTAAFAMTPATGLNLVAAVAFTQPGTAAGVARVKCAYRVWPTGL